MQPEACRGSGRGSQFNIKNEKRAEALQVFFLCVLCMYNVRIMYVLCTLNEKILRTFRSPYNMSRRSGSEASLRGSGADGRQLSSSSENMRGSEEVPKRFRSLQESRG